MYVDHCDILEPTKRHCPNIVDGQKAGGSMIRKENQRVLYTRIHQVHLGVVNLVEKLGVWFSYV
jgi:hypothetical protein